MPYEEGKTQIDQETIKKELSVPGDHACQNDFEGMCPVNTEISDNYISVKNSKYASCPHYIPFGYGGLCNSNVRRSIYNKYNI